MNRITRLLFVSLIPFAGSAVKGAPDRYPNTIYLIRHGAYNDQGPNLGSFKAGLTPLGIAQARLVAARLRGMPVHFDSMVSSNMQRAIDTAAIIHEMLPNVPWERSSIIHEVEPPRLDKEPTTPDETADANAAAHRLDEAFAKYFVPGEGSEKHTILVCHGNVIRYFVMKALKVDTRAWSRISIGHTSITVISVGPRGGFRVLSVGDMGHLPANMQSGIFDPNPELVVPAN